MTNNAIVPRTQIKHGFQTALLISHSPSVGWLKGNAMPAVTTAPEKLATAQTLFAETLLAALPQKAACTLDIQTCSKRSLCRVCGSATHAVAKCSAPIPIFQVVFQST